MKGGRGEEEKEKNGEERRGEKQKEGERRGVCVTELEESRRVEDNQLFKV